MSYTNEELMKKLMNDLKQKFNNRINPNQNPNPKYSRTRMRISENMKKKS